MRNRSSTLGRRFLTPDYNDDRPRVPQPSSITVAMTDDEFEDSDYSNRWYIRNYLRRHNLPQPTFIPPTNTMEHNQNPIDWCIGEGLRQQEISPQSQSGLPTTREPLGHPNLQHEE